MTRAALLRRVGGINDWQSERAELSPMSQRGGVHIQQAVCPSREVTSREVGRTWVFALALGTAVAWEITGPLFNFSDTWQLVMRGGITSFA
jgi:hypothetical protein